MTDLRLERDFAVSPDRLFTWVTDPDKLLQWWGPEGVTIPERELDFTRTGPWYSVMLGEESGRRFKVSGQVTHVEPRTSVGFTWGWHDDDDNRGHESHVTLTIVEAAGGARLIIDHRDLDGGEQSESHKTGWLSTLAKLEKKIN